MSGQEKQTKHWTFTLVLEGRHEPDSGLEDRLYEAGCDDALLTVQAGVASLEFDREAPSFEDALGSALKAARGAGCEVQMVAPDDLVSASEIARRAGVEREAVRLWQQGLRGPGGFPAPVARVVESSPLWSWAEVTDWLHAHGKLADEDTREAAKLLAAVNSVLRARRPELRGYRTKAAQVLLGRPGSRRGARKRRPQRPCRRRLT